MKKFKLTLILLIFVSCAWSGCVWFGAKPIDKDADPLVVQCERLQIMAKATFDSVLKLDDANRGWWKYQAPPFHQFCTWLREPVQLRDGTTLPRDRAVQMNLTWLKLDYKAAKVSTNEFEIAIKTFNAAIDQASGWMMIVTNSPIIATNGAKVLLEAPAPPKPPTPTK